MTGLVIVHPGSTAQLHCKGVRVKFYHLAGWSAGIAQGSGCAPGLNITRDYHIYDYEDDYYIDDYEMWENAETTKSTSILHQCWRT